MKNANTSIELFLKHRIILTRSKRKNNIPYKYIIGLKRALLKELNEYHRQKSTYEDCLQGFVSVIHIEKLKFLLLCASTEVIH